MKNDLKVKYLQFLSKKKGEEGFTLIELLVVIIIIGILSAIALPSFLNQAAKAKQSEAKTTIGAWNRAQQAYRMENTTGFAPQFTDMKLGSPTKTENYSYVVSGASLTTVALQAQPIDTASLRGFSGGVVIKTDGTTEAVACQTTDVVKSATLADPKLSDVVGTASDCTQGSMEAMK